MEAPPKSTTSSWKDKAKVRSQENARLRQEVKRQRQRAQKWLRRYDALAKQFSERPAGHSHALVIIWLAIYMHIHCNISLRATAKALLRVSELIGQPCRSLSHVTIRNWCLRYGLHELQRPLRAGKYALIIDESIELSKEVALAVLAVPLETTAEQRALGHRDAQVVGLGVSNYWKAAQISQVIHQASSPQVDFAYAVTDQCSTLRQALKIAAFPSAISLGQVRTAMDQTSMSQLQKWKAEHTVPTRLAKLRAIKNQLKLAA